MNDLETGRIRFVTGNGEVGERLDRTLGRRIERLSRTAARRLIEAGEVQVDSEIVTRASRTLVAGEVVTVTLREREPDSELVPEALPLRVLYEDDRIAVIDKQAGMVVHPAPGNLSGTLVHAVLHRFGSSLRALTDQARPGIVHRLDKGTSGVILIALDDAAHAHLQRQFAARSVHKEYLALAYGRLPSPEGTIDVPIGRDRTHRKKISANTSSPRAALTRWIVEQELPGTSWLRLVPATGRTHQLRAHLAHLRHPLVGDELYAGRQYKGVQPAAVRRALATFPRPALHAWMLEFEHPGTGERMRVSAPLPEDLHELLELLRQAATDGSGTRAGATSAPTASDTTGPDPSTADGTEPPPGP